MNRPAEAEEAPGPAARALGAQRHSTGGAQNRGRGASWWRVAGPLRAEWRASAPGAVLAQQILPLVVATVGAVQGALQSAIATLR